MIERLTEHYQQALVCILHSSSSVPSMLLRLPLDQVLFHYPKLSLGPGAVDMQKRGEVLLSEWERLQEQLWTCWWA